MPLSATCAWCMFQTCVCAVFSFSALTMLFKLQEVHATPQLLKAGSPMADLV